MINSSFGTDAPSENALGTDECPEEVLRRRGRAIAS